MGRMVMRNAPAFLLACVALVGCANEAPVHVEFHVNDATLAGPMSEALADWNRVCGYDLVLTDASGYGVSSVAVVDADGHGGLSGQTIRIRSDLGSAVLVQVLTHEVGHNLGFQHDPSPTSIMFWSIDVGAARVGVSPADCHR